MSIVTSYIILPPYSDGDSKLSVLNKILEDEGFSSETFKRVDDYAGGTKAMEAHVWAGAMNMFGYENMAKVLRVIKWSEPEQLVWCYCSHDEWYWKTRSGI